MEIHLVLFWEGGLEGLNAHFQPARFPAISMVANLKCAPPLQRRQVTFGGGGTRTKAQPLLSLLSARSTLPAACSKSIVRIFRSSIGLSTISCVPKSNIGPWKNLGAVNWAPVLYVFVLDIYCQQLGNICYN